VKHRYDTIIIGSGVSGMTAGILLAREGEKVLVLEQHTVPGGLMQTFQRRGAVFPTGVHRLGSLKKGQALWHYFNYLGVLDHLNLVEMDRNGFETFHFPGASFRIPAGHDCYGERLKGYFPGEAKAIDQYLSDMARVIGSLDFYHPGLPPAKTAGGNSTGSLDDYLKTLGVSARLKQVLTANNPFYGIPSNTCPVLTHFIVSDAYLNSAFRVDETTTPLAGAFSKSLAACEGEVHSNAKVNAVITDKGQARGVVLDNNKRLFSNRVIFTGHPAGLLELCDPKLFRPAFQKRLAGCENTRGFFGVAMTWKRRSCPVIDNDAFVYDSWDSNLAYHTPPPEDHRPGTVFLSALPCTETSGTVSVTALAGISPGEHQRMKALRNSGEPGRYQAEKQKLARAVMTLLSKQWPAMERDAEIIDTYTPGTFERYTLTPDGSAYGIQKKAGQFMQTMFHPATRVKNLFMAGQSISFNGIHGALVSSVTLCSHIVGKERLMEKIIKGESGQKRARKQGVINEKRDRTRK